jgi:cytochrome P450
MRGNYVQVINEVLRMGNVAPGLLRRTLTDIEFKGIYIALNYF